MLLQFCDGVYRCVPISFTIMWQLDFAAIQFQYSGLDKRCTTPVCVSFSLFLFICSLSLLGPREADLPGQIQPVTHSPTTWQEPRLLWRSRSSCLFHPLSPSFFLLWFLPGFLGGGLFVFLLFKVCFSLLLSHFEGVNRWASSTCHFVLLQ